MQNRLPYEGLNFLREPNCSVKILSNHINSVNALVSENEELNVPEYKI